MVKQWHEFELTAANATLRLTVDENHWTRVVLVEGEATTELGAECIEYIARKLYRFLAHPKADGQWILSLAERHASMYGEHLGDLLVIRIQDRDAKWIGHMQLDVVDRTAWVELLRAQLGNCADPEAEKY